MSNEDKILEILVKIQDNMSQMQGDITTLKQDVQFVRNVTTCIENDHGKKLDALFDGYSANYEIIGQYDSRVTKLERDVEKLSFEVRYLKVAK